LRTSDEYTDENTRNGVYQEGPRSDGNHSPKTRDLSLWYCRRNAALASFLRQFGWPTCWSSTRGPVSPFRWFFRLYIPLQRPRTGADLGFRL